MLESNHNIDEDYRHLSQNDGLISPSDTIKDIDISPLLMLFPRNCLSCCSFYKSRDDDGIIVDRGGSSFSSLTQRLLTPQPGAGGGGGGAISTTSSGERDANRRMLRRAHQRPTLINKNVFLHYLVIFFQGTADSLWRGSILSIFVVQLNPGYLRYIGYFEAMFGLGGIISTMFYPYASPDGNDNGMRNNGLQSSARQRQQTRDENNHTPGPGRQNIFTLKCAGLTLVVTATANIILLAKLSDKEGQDNRLFYQMLMIILLFYGYSTTVLLSSSAAHALLRQSTMESKNYNSRTAAERPLILASNMAGPLVSIIIFGAVGNTYSIRNLRIIWYVGCGLEVFVGILSLWFSERYYLLPVGEEGEQESLERSRLNSSRDETQNGGVDCTDADDEGDVIDDDDSALWLQSKIDRVFGEEGKARASNDIQQSALDEPLPLQASRTLEDENTSPSIDGHLSLESPSLLPQVLFVLVSLLFVVGGALFHPYWPVFFKDIPLLPPIQLQLLYSIIPIIAMICDAIIQKMLKQKKTAYCLAISIAVRFLSAAFVMIIGSYQGGGSSPLAILLFVFRGAFLDSAKEVETGGFAYFISNTGTPTWKRGLEMAKMILWSIFAAVGGVLIESKSGYGYVLRLTGILEFSGVLCFGILAAILQRV